ARGFHALHDWDGKAARVNPDAIAVDVLTFVAERRGREAPDIRAVALLLDYYLLYLLALLALAAFYEDDPDACLDRVTDLLRALQGSGGGRRFADDAETLMLLATSHYSANDGAFDRLLEITRGLGRGRRLTIALQHAASLGSHLRYGFEATYGR